jgi:acyl transferase domain-containing protein/acyl carrier protein
MRRDNLLTWLRANVAAIAAVPEDDVDVELPLSAYGIDSAATAGMAAGLEAMVGAPVDVGVLFAQGSIADLADALLAPDSAKQVTAPAGPAPGHVEPVAIVGLACRVPGATSPKQLWELLIRGGEAVTEVPPGRWPAGAVPDTSAARHGGFLEDVAGFDADFFHIPQEEAARMDPQHRLLLEVAWECFEDAGIPPDALRGPGTGVFVGISTNEYGRRQLADADTVNALTPTGNALAVAANRLSYTYDLRGPSIAVDTACSSSLTALHLAVRSLRSGECRRALVCGVNLLLEPEVSLALANAGMLAPDGRCKTFDASANGYVRAEGCVALLLEAPYSRSRHAYALVRGSAMNQDGRTNGLTAPSGDAQVRVLAAAYADAGIDPATVEYAECHGTGTYLGDPIEARSLGKVVGIERRTGPCVIGSVKTNVGHMEAAAGLVGVAKVMLALDRGTIPPSLHVRTPNPQIDLDRLGLALADAPRPWAAAGNARIAGVSSFGFGGTNVHVVLSGLETCPAARAEPVERPYIVPVSARSEQACADAAAGLAALARHGDADVAAVASATAFNRSHLPFRTAVLADDRAGLAAALDAAATRTARRPRREAPRIGMMFTGQGSQHPTMARRLGERFPVFASTIARCDEVIGKICDWRLRDVLDSDRSSRLDSTEIAQPALFAVAAGLVAIWRSIGVIPAAVAGHSVGELAAAYAADVLTLEQAVRLAVRRGEAMADTCDLGGMLAIDGTAEEAEALVAEAGAGADVAVAAVNGPRMSVLSGDWSRLTAIAALRAEAGRFARRLPVRYAFHSPQMSRAAARFETVVANEKLADPAVPMFSSVTGRRVDHEVTDAGHWRRNVGDTVRFADALQAMLEEPIDVLLEIGPHPDLAAPARQAVEAAGREVPVLASLRRTIDGDRALLETAAALYEEGVNLSWRRLARPVSPTLSLPTYPWQHRHHWIDRPAARREARGRGGLLGSRIDLAGDRASVWEVEPGRAAPFLADHRVEDVPVFPAAGYVELMVAAGREAGLAGPLTLEGVRLHAFLPLGDGAVRMQTSLTRCDGTVRVLVHGRSAGSDRWTLHAEGQIGSADGHAPVHSLLGAQVECLDQMPRPLFYGRLRQRGLGYGDAFQVLTDIWRSETEAIARLRPPSGGTAADARTLDGALQLLAAASDAEDEQLYVPVGFDRVVVHGGPASDARVHSRMSGDASADAWIVGPDDRVLVAIEGIHLARVERRHRPKPTAATWEYDVVWRPEPLVANATLQGRRILVVSEGKDKVRALVSALAAAGADVVTADMTHASGDPKKALMERINAVDRRFDTVIFACALGGQADEELTPERSVHLSAHFVALLQAVSFASAAGTPDVWVVTRGVHVLDGDNAPAACRLAAPLWGLLKAAPFENPSLRCRAIDIDDVSEPGTLRQLVAELASATDESEVALRRDGRFVRRLIIASPSVPRVADRVIDPEGTYIVTGGHGALGARVARWLGAGGARHLALLGRHAHEDSDLVTSLRSAGVEVLSLACDVSSQSQVAAAIGRARELGPLRGIVHAAGVLDDGPLLRMEAPSLSGVLGPKIAGAWWIAGETADDAVEWVAYFSSAASVLGSPGQANYCAANAFLDAFVQDVARVTPTAVAVNWGPWAGDGMAADSATSAAYSKLAPDAALAVLERLLAGHSRQRVVLPFDLRNLVQFYPVVTGLPFFQDIDSDIESLRSIGTRSASGSRPVPDHELVPPRNPIEEQIAGIWQVSLGIDRVGIFDQFFELGGDSVFGNQIIVAINRALGVSVNVERAFDDFTVARLAELAEEALVERLTTMTDEEARDVLDRTRQHDG